MKLLPLAAAAVVPAESRSNELEFRCSSGRSETSARLITCCWAELAEAAVCSSCTLRAEPRTFKRICRVSLCNWNVATMGIATPGKRTWMR